MGSPTAPQWRKKPIARARRLRRQSTNAELALWRQLRRKQVGSFKFRRQRSVGPYIVDFVCLEAGIIIEVDGGQHAIRSDDDARRTAWLEKHGFRVMRFWNNEVLGNLEGVFATVEAALSSPLPDPLPQAGEGVRPSSHDLKSKVRDDD